MSNKKYKKVNRIIFAIIYIIAFFILSSYGYAADNTTSDSTQSEESTNTTTEDTTVVDTTKIPKVSDTEYIYLDLYYGNITISANTYTGYVLKDGQSTQVTGTIDRKLYIYQSNGDSTVWENGLPKYSRVTAPANSGKSTWGDYITDNTNISQIITNWSTQASAVNRTSSAYYIKITGNANCDITIDNIWSSYHENSTSRRSGAISFYPATSTASTVTLKFKGDNRLGNIYYGTNSYTNHQMIFQGDSDATLTVANLSTSSTANHYNSAIGGSDNSGGDTRGMIFESGIIFAGTTSGDNCTAIGAGGNATGDITINGGTITAVTNSTGAAIGGGIGYSSYGGNANVEINGGNIYAYNFGYNSIPAAAIGGGSSRSTHGNASTTVTITGGSIFAQSTGGVAIGGGGSQLGNGGPASVEITGGTVIAQSIANTSKSIQAGAGIGGGTGVNGGDATLSISGNAVVKTGSIGGGKTNTTTGKIGSATIVLSGTPTIQGQFIMESATEDNPCSFTMNGGTIDNANKDENYTFLQENGGAIHLVNGSVTMNGGTIKNCTATNGGAVYVSGGDFIMTSGTISNNTATNEGGAIKVEDGNITIGLESCKGNDDTHSHPVIEKNTATKNGGGISISGGEVFMYCGNLISNGATENQSGNSIYHTGGVFNLYGGDIGIGIYVTENAIFNDYREATYQVTYHAIYDGVDEQMTTYVKSNEKLKLPKETEIENNNFTRDGLYLIGWSTSSTTDSGYIVVGSEIYVPQDTDLYAVWGTEEPIASYTVYIPETVTISEKEKTGKISIGATLKYFTNIANLVVKLENKGNLLVEDKSLEYTIKDSSNNTINVGDTVATFTSVNQLENELTAEITGTPKYAGEYSDVVTFSITYNSGS